MTRDLLPAHVGRILGVHEAPRAEIWLINGLVSATGLTAIAVYDSKDRTGLGVATLQALIGGGSVAERPVTRPVRSALVLATTEYTASLYRASTLGDQRVDVAAVRPWDGHDETYWTALHQLAATYGVVLIDTVQWLANGNPGTAIARGLDGFAPPVVGMYAGNVREPGIGGDVAWAGARNRFWHNPKTSELHPLDSGDNPWGIQIPSPRNTRAATDPPPPF